MTEPRSIDDDATEQIAQKRERLETIIDQLEDGEVSLERAKELHTEGKELIQELETDLDLGDGAVTVEE